MSPVHGRRRTAVALLGAAALALGLTTLHTPGASAEPQRVLGRLHLPYQDPRLPVRQRVADLLARMTLAEKIGQMTQAERGGIDTDTPRSRPTTSAACCPAAARCRRRTPRRRGRTWSTATSAPRSPPAAHPDHLRDRHRARRRKHGRRDGLPAQHRPRRHPRPGAGERGRAHRRRGDPVDRTRSGRSRRASASRATIAGVAPTSRSARTRSSSSAMETAIDGLPGPARPLVGPTACWPPPSTSPATA